MSLEVVAALSAPQPPIQPERGMAWLYISVRLVVDRLGMADEKHFSKPLTRDEAAESANSEAAGFPVSSEGWRYLC